MLKTWMDSSRASLSYRVEILYFLRYAYANANNEVKKPCPCCKCINSSNHDRPTMYEHLTINGMLPDYRIWDFHGEKSMGQSCNNMSSGLQASLKLVSEKTNHGHVVQEMLREAFGMPEEPFMNNENFFGTSTSHTPNESNVEDFYRLVDEGKQPLYNGCTEFSKLTFLVELFQLKVSGKWSDKSFTALLDFLRRVLPSEAQASFDILDQHRASVMQMMGVSWRRWKTEVKATSYDPNIQLSELVSIRPIPHDLTPEVWQTLCRYWKSNERTSRINRENGSKKRGIHAQGRTNIASLEYKFVQENGRKPTRIEILHLSRQSKKKGGALVDDEAIRVENLLNDAVQRHLQDKPEGTQPTEVHEEAFRDIFGPEHSGRVRCLGAGALPSQVFPDQYKPRLFLTQSNLPTSDVTNKLQEMEDKMISMEEQRKEEMERMREMHEHQLQNFRRVIQSMVSGTAGGSRELELLPTQMATIVTDIMQQQTNTLQNVHER